MQAAETDPSLPIAVFDSGVGGLTVLHECLVSLPEEDFVYLGDDARFPYGARSAEELRAHVEQVSRFVLGRGAKLMVIACNSAASAGLEVARQVAGESGVEVVAVIEPEAEIAAAVTDTGNVGVLATPATVQSGAYRSALARQHRAVVLPHMGSATIEGRIDMGEKVIVNIKTFMDGHRPPDRVLPSML